MLSKTNFKSSVKCSMPQKLSSHLSRREDWQRSRSLAERLQTTLDVGEFFALYASHLNTRIPIKQIHFESESLNHRVLIQDGPTATEHAVLVYADEQLLGQVTYTFLQPLSFLQKLRLKKVHAHLVFPLRNLLAFQHMSQLASRDPLTQLYNRTIIEPRLTKLIKSAHQQQHTVMMVDLDNFKHVNDREGHEVGDEILQEIASLISEEVDPDHFVIRFGGDEFLLIMPHTELRLTHDIFKRMQQRLCNHSLISKYGITLSAGSVRLQPYLSVEQVLNQVDDNMYIAKHAGGARHIFDSLDAQVNLPNDQRL
ncbi:GGDEF domain-containing protein [Idiomarina fontislapidosi]|uniref:diguanylate cyclase n=1 Tax=Idiomarina fontislapidosi TaxID=263723 RepID=A0A432XRT9_9GAMM|nr:GGDEF domain-containing protein [Idiomarina fontislapidosi]RUO51427.1 hypothetical protein CWE25_10860 [Idiomarina fontislapidosi]